MSVKSATAFGLSSGLEPGMVLLNTTSFSGVASQSINNVFSATYKNYRVVIDYVTASGGNVTGMRLRSSGSDNSTSNYQKLATYPSVTDVAFERANNASSWLLLSNSSGDSYSIALDFINPFASLHTQVLALSGYRTTATSGNEIVSFAMGFTGTTSFDGFSLLSNGPNLTGTIQIYAYNQ